MNGASSRASRFRRVTDPPCPYHVAAAHSPRPARDYHKPGRVGQPRRGLTPSGTRRRRPWSSWLRACDGCGSGFALPRPDQPDCRPELHCCTGITLMPWRGGTGAGPSPKFCLGFDAGSAASARRRSICAWGTERTQVVLGPIGRLSWWRTRPTALKRSSNAALPLLAPQQWRPTHCSAERLRVQRRPHLCMTAVLEPGPECRS